MKKLYKAIIQNFFFLVHGKVYFKKYDSKIVSKKDIKIDNQNYEIYKIKNGRVFTNYVETLAVISNQSIIKEVSFQQINGKL